MLKLPRSQVDLYVIIQDKSDSWINMPGRNNTGSGSIFRQSGKMTRSVRNIADNKDELLTQKRTEKAMREAYRKERKLASYLAEDENFPSFRIQMTKMGLQLRDIPADG